METKTHYRSSTFVHFSRPLTLSREKALVVDSGHKPALHVDVERIMVRNSEKAKGELVGGVILFEKREEDGEFSMVVDEGLGREERVLDLKNFEWCTVPAFEYHNAFTLFGEQELEIIEPAITGAVSIFHNGKAKLNVSVFKHE